MRTELRLRTRQYALRIIRLYTCLPNRGVPGVLGSQILRSGTSVGAQYREAYRAKSNADFVNKIEGALQELDETAYWLELLADADIINAKRLERLHAETDELIAILVTIVRKVKAQPKSKKA
jgi:four helix bundle protein